MLVHVAAAVETLEIIDDFGNDIKAGERIDVYVFFPFGIKFIGCVDCGICLLDELFDIRLLLRG